VTGLGDSLRRLSDDELAALLVARPELADPPPASINDLASRATAPYSVNAALAALDGVQRQVLDALALLGEPSSAADIVGLAFEQPPVEVIASALERAKVLGLCVGTQIIDGGSELYSLTPAMRRMIAAPFDLRGTLAYLLDRYAVPDLRLIVTNLGLEPRAVAKVGQIQDVVAYLTSPQSFGELLDRAPGGAVSVLIGIHDGGCVLDIDLRPWSRRAIDDDIAWLLSHALLIPFGADAAVIPREVAIALRGGSVLRSFSTAAPTVGVREGHELASRRAGIVELNPLAVIDTIRRIGSTWAQETIPSLKSGGVPVKELRTTAKALGFDEASAARLIEIAGVAGLLLADPFTERVGPTAAFEEWISSPPLDRWLHVVRAWQFSSAPISRVVLGLRSSKIEAPLSPSYYSDIDEVWRRVRVVEALASVDVDGVPNSDDVAKRAHWHGPGRWASVGDAVEYTAELLAEMSILGVLRGGALSPLGRAALLGSDEELAASAEQVFPTVVSTFTIQGDGTAIAPAELDGAVASELALIGELSSSGAATVYRITETSLRRAFDLGRTTAEIVGFLTDHARPSVPQALGYLIEDVARRHGTLRVGSAASFVRCDDPALLQQVVRTKKAAKAKLRVIAPTVAVSTLTPVKLVVALRDAGFLPVQEDGEGEVVVRQPATVKSPYALGRPRTREDAAARTIWSGAGSSGPNAGPAAAEIPDRVAALVRRLRAAG
jgi:Helicase conserved C-terminal domain